MRFSAPAPCSRSPPSHRRRRRRSSPSPVNNGDMIRMQKLSDDFRTKNPGIELNWVTLEENALRQKVTTDIATKGGQFDVLTIGTYEVPIWGKKGWLVPLDKLG